MEESIANDVALGDGCAIPVKAVPTLFQPVALMAAALARPDICLFSQDCCTEQPETNVDKAKQPLESNSSPGVMYGGLPLSSMDLRFLICGMGVINDPHQGGLQR